MDQEVCTGKMQRPLGTPRAGSIVREADAAPWRAGRAADVVCGHTQTALLLRPPVPGEEGNRDLEGTGKEGNGEPLCVWIPDSHQDRGLL